MHNSQLDPLPHIEETDTHVGLVIDRIWSGVRRVWRRENEIRDGRYDAQRLECDANNIMNRVVEYGDSGEHTMLADYLDTPKIRTWLTNYHLADLTHLDINRACRILRLAETIKRKESFAMALHERLGNRSQAQKMGVDMFRKILDYV
jgi:hypothetical protein